MKRELPLFICALMGITMIIQYFIPHPYSIKFYQTVIGWFIIIMTFAFVLGIMSIARVHWNKVSRKQKDWFYSLVALISLSVTLFVGFAFGIERGKPFMLIFEYIQVPMESTMFSLLAFYIASAAFRTFRARTFEATLLLIAAVIVMLGRVPIGYMISSKIPAISGWILDIPNLAAKRGIMIGVGLGSISMGLKIILGVERSWLGTIGGE
ncbi:MAG: hypothetical protein B6D57_00100 [Candidatus Coatesbacteria bacterium 4484_99]|uniref:Uncharacterized protein n=1 Tax=Candidatus Coatesbacteria bacterium 4484_99 TaxID=1970774 RepID=A0A1W9S3C1_9BACT|nr:MAG: hypothetical protein B6D57_00100 [Candidatus Coatesbacteria bacterium 4484_99]RLC42495.1 MAG: hypothetical protein DRH44_06265 [Candidatus Coatesbacteria bacterium]RLC42567.1 MAG: hypothetical protein DRH51_00490 [Candidatus Coatesbacteria bacterium]RLC42615.1 MAG: hypothetical protein DRH49_03530 [Candidatus Coatesbacteria bacterium]